VNDCLGDPGEGPIRITRRPGPSPSVGARAVGSGREGLYGRPRPVHLAAILGKHDHLPTPRATLKAPMPITRRPSPSTSVGAGVDEDEGLGRLRRPRPVHLVQILRKHDHHPSSTTLAPTDHPALCLASRLQLTARTTLACSHSRAALCCQVRVYWGIINVPMGGRGADEG